MFGNENPIFEFRGPWGVPIQFGQSVVFLVIVIMGLNSLPGALLYGGIFLGVLILSILLHELGHAWGALIQGVPVTRIMITGGGGFCERARSASPQQDELIVAMGPIVNLAIWAIAGLALPYITSPMLYHVVSLTAMLNIYLALFNLLPLMPLDGGRLFHLGLLRIFDGPKATRIAGALGLIGCVIWLPFMIYSYISLGFLLIFIPSLAIHLRMFRTGQL